MKRGFKTHLINCVVLYGDPFWRRIRGVKGGIELE